MTGTTIQKSNREIESLNKLGTNRFKTHIIGQSSPTAKHTSFSNLLDVIQIDGAFVITFTLVSFKG